VIRDRKQFKTHSQFSIHTRFANNTNGHFVEFALIRVNSLAKRFFWRNQRTRIITNRII